jgi:hypothetical protein
VTAAASAEFVAAGGGFRIWRTKGMVSRALSLATVTLLCGCFAAKPAQAQNLEAGKSPAQIFAGTCNACHKSPRGLLKTVPAGSLQGFLRQHYTTSSEMASLLSAFLVSNGAADARVVGGQGKPGGPPDQLDRFGRKLRPGAPSQEAAGREGERREASRPDAAKPATGAQTPIQAAGEYGPDGRKLSAKQRLSKRGKPGAEEPPKTDAAKGEAREEPSKGEAAKEETPKSETAKVEGGQPESTKSESAKIEPPKDAGSGDSPVLRPDPVPPVTPAPATPPAVSAAVTGGVPELASPSPAAALPPAVTASAPPLPPVAPAGPPAPPISQ